MKKIIVLFAILLVLSGCGEKKEEKKETKNEFEKYIETNLEQIDKAEAAVDKMNKNVEMLEKTSKELNKE